MAHRNVVASVHLVAGGLLLTASFLAGSGSHTDLMISAAQAAEETPKDELAAQIRIQGFACDQPLRATRDAKRSRPDHAVWVLKCSNATYRVGRAPDMAANVQRLK
ncbi:MULTISPECIES: hypothetical protein [unclassified Bradyrhizobium]|uniref:hypothetical protein n=1 Tax=unclassified Bradyrhizobium TaxID=2631580 RepID=UPI0020B273AB|nr:MULTISPECIES: hypothetical protein [unclassified Bradyrhizobium]MCP3380779.1 hypothetical protein [Bradyrhizobium sp. CCGUVB4N]MCP3441652.1 hypothetical protein [Bradyrhizobium sp. CCGUVB14]